MDNYDNVVVRLRGQGLAVASVEPPFRTAHWPSIEALASGVGLLDVSAATFEQPQIQARLLVALADRVPGCEVFRPRRVRHRLSSQEIRRREAYRSSRRTVTFLGPCPQEVLLGGLEVATHGLSPKSSVEVQFKDSDLLADWRLGADQVREVYSFLFQAKHFRVNVLIYTELQEFDGSLADFIYEHPPTRVVWLAMELAECANAAELGRFSETGSAFTNLRKASNRGIWRTSSCRSREQT